MLIEMILGECAPSESIDSPIQYSIANEAFRATINGDAAFEPVAPLRERFAKLKARDSLLGAVLAKLAADPGASEGFAHLAVGKALADGEALAKIAQGLGLSGVKHRDLAAQVLAMNTEITAALAKARDRVSELENQAAGDSAAAFHDLCLAQDENARIRAEVEQERSAKLIAEDEVRKLTATLRSQMDDTRAAKAEIEALKLSLDVRELERVLACARVTGLAAELQEFERAVREKLRT